jgi:hypothetical protein
MALNAPGLGGTMRSLQRNLNQSLPRNQKTPMPRPRNKAGSMGAIRNPSRDMQRLRTFGRY